MKEKFDEESWSQHAEVASALAWEEVVVIVLKQKWVLEEEFVA